MNKKIFTNKYYTHLDIKKDYHHYIHRIKDPNWVKSHGFYPFIHYQIVFHKYKSDNGKKKKVRNINYAAHIDRFIYQYYGNKLNNIYNSYCKQIGIGNVSTAYRNNSKGKCNIHFAREVFEFLVKTKEAFVFVGDFSNFFDNLDHKYLKEKICTVSNKEMLDDAEYAVYKNITRYSFVEAKEIEIFKSKLRRDMRDYDKYFLTREFQEFKKGHLYRNYKTYGIPQGSSISSVYANVYMIEFDKMLNDYATSKQGIYRRYCDDIIMIIPMNKEQFQYREYEHHIIKVDQIRSLVKNLDLNIDKTEQFFYSSDTISKISGESNIINYLGFSFNGKVIRIREKSMFKYYCRAYKKIKSVQFARDSKSMIAAKKALYKSYTHLGNKKNKKGYGNFITYTYKAEKIFSESDILDNEIHNQIKRHWKKINERLKLGVET
ncbi:MAG: hypothetical protein K0S41_1958 [Anaerocolumna sp.]|jgi:hypothetical protein|nr:hypothetical protein [Anaerocolumna sp.]